MKKVVIKTVVTDEEGNVSLSIENEGFTAAELIAAFEGASKTVQQQIGQIVPFQAPVNTSDVKGNKVTKTLSLAE